MKAPSSEELAGLEARVTAALETGDESGLRVLGYGEISTVVALESKAGSFACKRLPPFASQAQFDRYRELFERYLADLERHGVTPVKSLALSQARPQGDLGVFCVQPLFPAQSLMVKHLAGCSEAQAVEVFGKLLERIVTCVGPTRGLDGQLSNWVLVDSEPQYIDVTTPMLRDEAGRDLLDLDLFLASLPWLLRGLVKRFMLADILDKYYQPRGVVLDLLGNLFKEGLERFLKPFIAEANKRFTPSFTVDEAWKYYAGDAQTWKLLLAVRRFDRWWQRTVRRRTYRFLLPGHIERNLKRPASL